MDQIKMLLTALMALLGLHGAAPPPPGQQPPPGGAETTTLAPPPGSCVLTPPANMLTAQGLATPWELSGVSSSTRCTEQNANTAVFVEATILDPATGHLSVYDPLVVDGERRPAAPPVVPALPQNAAVGIWVGANSTVVLPSGIQDCTDGLDSVFSQQAYCNVPQFLLAVNTALQQGRVTVPPIGTAKDGKPCPTARDFSVVDQDQSDNDLARYLITPNKRVAQDTAANRDRFPNAEVTFNGSDEGVIIPSMDAALGCKPWQVTDLADPQQTAGSGLLNEIQASTQQGQPVATVPAGDDFVLSPAPAGAPDLRKLNLYRAQVDQPPVQSLTQSSPGPVSANTTTYCQNLLHAGLPRIADNRDLLKNQPSPFPATANNLFSFLANRFLATFDDQPGFLHCTALLGVQNPVIVTPDKNGVVVNAAINLNPPPLKGTEPASGARTNAPNPTSVVNWQPT